MKIFKKISKLLKFKLKTITDNDKIKDFRKKIMK